MVVWVEWGSTVEELVGAFKIYMIHICMYVFIYTDGHMNINMCIHNIGGVSRVGVDGGGCSWCIRRM